MIEIKNLFVEADKKSILKGINLKINRGEIHAIMGPNGAGKSTLAKTIAGAPYCEVKAGDILFEGESLFKLSVEERARRGIFIGFQSPIEISGVNNFEFLFAAFNAKRAAHKEKSFVRKEFESFLKQKMAESGLEYDFKDRNLNEGFSGGEKKKNELLQMAILEPKLSILDEADSGLDIDAVKKAAISLKKMMNGDRSICLITHYSRLLEHIEPDIVHVMIDGKIVTSGKKELVTKLEKEGYDWLKKL